MDGFYKSGDWRQDVNMNRGYRCRGNYREPRRFQHYDDQDNCYYNNNNNNNNSGFNNGNLHNDCGNNMQNDGMQYESSGSGYPDCARNRYESYSAREEPREDDMYDDSDNYCDEWENINWTRPYHENKHGRFNSVARGRFNPCNDNRYQRPRFRGNQWRSSYQSKPYYGRERPPFPKRQLADVSSVNTDIPSSDKDDSASPDTSAASISPEKSDALVSEVPELSATQSPVDVDPNDLSVICANADPEVGLKIKQEVLEAAASPERDGEYDIENVLQHYGCETQADDDELIDNRTEELDPDFEMSVTRKDIPSNQNNNSDKSWEPWESVTPNDSKKWDKTSTKSNTIISQGLTIDPNTSFLKPRIESPLITFDIIKKRDLDELKSCVEKRISVVDKQMLSNVKLLNVKKLMCEEELGSSSMDISSSDEESTIRRIRKTHPKLPKLLEPLDLDKSCRSPNEEHYTRSEQPKIQTTQPSNDNLLSLVVAKEHQLNEALKEVKKQKETTPTQKYNEVVEATTNKSEQQVTVPVAIKFPQLVVKLPKIAIKIPEGVETPTTIHSNKELESILSEKETKTVLKDTQPLQNGEAVISNSKLEEPKLPQNSNQTAQSNPKLEDEKASKPKLDKVSKQVDTHIPNKLEQQIKAGLKLYQLAHPTLEEEKALKPKLDKVSKQVETHIPNKLEQNKAALKHNQPAQSNPKLEEEKALKPKLDKVSKQVDTHIPNKLDQNKSALKHNQPAQSNPNMEEEKASKQKLHKDSTQLETDIPNKPEQNKAALKHKRKPSQSKSKLEARKSRLDIPLKNFDEITDLPKEFLDEFVASLKAKLKLERAMHQRLFDAMEWSKDVVTEETLNLILNTLQSELDEMLAAEQAAATGVGVHIERMQYEVAGWKAKVDDLQSDDLSDAEKSDIKTNMVARLQHLLRTTPEDKPVAKPKSEEPQVVATHQLVKNVANLLQKIEPSLEKKQKGSKRKKGKTSPAIKFNVNKVTANTTIKKDGISKHGECQNSSKKSSKVKAKEDSKEEQVDEGKSSLEDYKIPKKLKHSKSEEKDASIGKDRAEELNPKARRHSKAEEIDILKQKDEIPKKVASRRQSKVEESRIKHKKEEEHPKVQTLRDFRRPKKVEEAQSLKDSKVLKKKEEEDSTKQSKHEESTKEDAKALKKESKKMDEAQSLKDVKIPKKKEELKEDSTKEELTKEDAKASKKLAARRQSLRDDLKEIKVPKKTKRQSSKDDGEDVASLEEDFKTPKIRFEDKDGAKKEAKRRMSLREDEDVRVTKEDPKKLKLVEEVCKPFKYSLTKIDEPEKPAALHSRRLSLLSQSSEEERRLDETLHDPRIRRLSENANKSPVDEQASKKQRMEDAIVPKTDDANKRRDSNVTKPDVSQSSNIQDSKLDEDSNIAKSDEESRCRPSNIEDKSDEERRSRSSKSNEDKTVCFTPNITNFLPALSKPVEPMPYSEVESLFNQKANNKSTVKKSITKLPEVKRDVAKNEGKTKLSFEAYKEKKRKEDELQMQRKKWLNRSYSSPTSVAITAGSTNEASQKAVLEKETISVSPNEANKPEHSSSNLKLEEQDKEQSKQSNCPDKRLKRRKSLERSKAMRKMCKVFNDSSDDNVDSPEAPSSSSSSTSSPPTNRPYRRIKSHLDESDSSPVEKRSAPKRKSIDSKANEAPKEKKTKAIGDIATPKEGLERDKVEEIVEISLLSSESDAMTSDESNTDKCDLSKTTVVTSVVENTATSDGIADYNHVTGVNDSAASEAENVLKNIQIVGVESLADRSDKEATFPKQIKFKMEAEKNDDIQIVAVESLSDHSDRYLIKSEATTNKVQNQGDVPTFETAKPVEPILQVSKQDLAEKEDELSRMVTPKVNQETVIISTESIEELFPSPSRAGQILSMEVTNNENITSNMVILDPTIVLKQEEPLIETIVIEDDDEKELKVKTESQSPPKVQELKNESLMVRESVTMEWFVKEFCNTFTFLENTYQCQSNYFGTNRNAMALRSIEAPLNDLHRMIHLYEVPDFDIDKFLQMAEKESKLVYRPFKFMLLVSLAGMEPMKTLHAKGFYLLAIESSCALEHEDPNAFREALSDISWFVTDSQWSFFLEQLKKLNVKMEMPVRSKEPREMPDLGSMESFMQEYNKKVAMLAAKDNSTMPKLQLSQVVFPIQVKINTPPIMQVNPRLLPTNHESVIQSTNAAQKQIAVQQNSVPVQQNQNASNYQSPSPCQQQQNVPTIQNQNLKQLQDVQRTISPVRVSKDLFPRHSPSGSPTITTNGIQNNNVIQYNPNIVPHNPNIVAHNPNNVSHNPNNVLYNPNIMPPNPNSVQQNSNVVPHNFNIVQPNSNNVQLNSNILQQNPNSNIIQHNSNMVQHKTNIAQQSPVQHNPNMAQHNPNLVMVPQNSSCYVQQNEMIQRNTSGLIQQNCSGLIQQNCSGLIQQNPNENSSCLMQQNPQGLLVRNPRVEQIANEVPIRREINPNAVAQPKVIVHHPAQQGNARAAQQFAPQTTHHQNPGGYPEMQMRTGEVPMDSNGVPYKVIPEFSKGYYRTPSVAPQPRLPAQQQMRFYYNPNQSNMQYHQPWQTNVRAFLTPEQKEAAHYQAMNQQRLEAAMRQEQVQKAKLMEQQALYKVPSNPTYQQTSLQPPNYNYTQNNHPLKELLQQRANQKVPTSTSQQAPSKVYNAIPKTAQTRPFDLSIPPLQPIISTTEQKGKQSGAPPLKRRARGPRKSSKDSALSLPSTMTEFNEVNRGKEKAKPNNEMNDGAERESPRIASVDSGISSPVEYRNTREEAMHNLCICGNVAENACMCLAVHYCSTQCQSFDWENHMPTCKYIPK